VKLQIDEMEQWEFGALGIHNPNRSTLTPYFQLVRETESISGDILELGVLRGASLITTGLLLESLLSKRVVTGLDTFTGFPGYTEQDNFNNFWRLEELGLISSEHLEKVKRNQSLVKIRGASEAPNSISNSNNFSDTSYNLVRSRILNLELEQRVFVHEVDITKELGNYLKDKKYSLILMDVDLYLPYAKALPILFEHLSPGGKIYLDEYYSLKFPGPRLAVHDFLREKQDATLEKLEDWLDFERWIIKKDLSEIGESRED
jgi:hypothetical protein